MLREDVIDLEFFMKLLSLKLSGLWDLDHDARVDLIDERDASPPDPVHTRKLALDIHESMTRRRCEKRYLEEQAGVEEGVTCSRREVRKGEKGMHSKFA